VAAVFDQPAAAQQALESFGLDPQRQLGLWAPPSDGRGLLVGINRAEELPAGLVSLGVPEGEARYLMDEVRNGRTLVVVDAGEHSAEVREQLLAQGGYDVQSRGGELARAEGAGVPGGAGPRPIDLTGHWPDVASRYRMLWQQHYGTTDATWEQVEPIYRYAWERANAPADRGRPWSEVAASIQREWQSRPGAPEWSSVAGPMRDVWEDVADEASSGAEGGQDRRIPRQGADQAGPAREVVPPGPQVA
jgi:hypothetical protein